MSVDKATGDPGPTLPAAGGDAGTAGAAPSSAADAVLVRSLLRDACVATLATTDRATADRPVGRAYASLVEVATTVDGQPVLLLSQLARHTRNILADPDVSLLVDRREAGGNALAAPRATLMGRLRIDASPLTRERYLRRHPTGAGFADFGDFQFWSLSIESAHMIAGFGRIREVGAEILRLEHRLGEAAPDFIAALARNEARLIDEFESELRSRGKPSHWERIVGLDPEGVDVVRHGRPDRIAIAAPATDMASFKHSILTALAIDGTS